jgi:hypothetical protein
MARNGIPEYLSKERTSAHTETSEYVWRMYRLIVSGIASPSTTEPTHVVPSRRFGCFSFGIVATKIGLLECLGQSKLKT